MRKIENITGLLVRAYEPAGHEDFPLSEREDHPGGEVAKVGDTEVWRVSWDEKPKRLVAVGTVVTDAPRKPRRKGTVSVPRERLPMIADRAKLTADEREAWLAQYPATGKAPIVNDATAALLTSASRKIIDAMVGTTLIIEAGKVSGGAILA